jgi:prevent-host-death family protein
MPFFGLARWLRVATFGHMKPKKPDSKLPKGLKPWMLQESRAAYSEPLEVSVRVAKDQLSSLLERAAQGRDVVITSDGKPKAMLVRYRPVITGKPAKSLRALRESMPVTPDSTELISEQRESGY